MNRATNWEGLPLVMQIADVQEALGISRNKAYELAHLYGIRLGKRLVVPKERLQLWLATGGIEGNTQPSDEKPVGGRYLPPLTAQLRESWGVTNDAK